MNLFLSQIRPASSLEVYHVLIGIQWLLIYSSTFVFCFSISSLTVCSDLFMSRVSSQGSWSKMLLDWHGLLLVSVLSALGSLWVWGGYWELILSLVESFFWGVPMKLLITWDLLPSIPLIEIMSPLPMALLTFLFLMVLSTHTLCQGPLAPAGNCLGGKSLYSLLRAVLFPSEVTSCP